MLKCVLFLAMLSHTNGSEIKTCQTQNKTCTGTWSQANSCRKYFGGKQHIYICLAIFLSLLLGNVIWSATLRESLDADAEEEREREREKARE
jgi:hypothetical protein